MNAQFLGRWDLAPRSHPNDGMVDVSDGDLPVGDRLKARRRLPTGSHIPHPAIATRRVKHETLTFDRPIGIWLDGVDIDTASNVVIRVEPDAATVVA